MSKAKEILDKIKIELGIEKELIEEPKEVKETFLDAALADGTLVQIEPELVEGAAVMVQNPESETGFSPMPDGEVELASGEIITTVDGVITVIVAVAEEEVVEEASEEVVEEEMETEEQRVRKIVESTIKESHFASVEEVATLKEENESLKGLISEMKEAQTKSTEAFLKAVEELANEPAKEPIKKTKKSFSGLEKKKNIFER